MEYHITLFCQGCRKEVPLEKLTNIRKKSLMERGWPAIYYCKDTCYRTILTNEDYEFHNDDRLGFCGKQTYRDVFDSLK